MSDKFLTEGEWKKFSKGRTVKDAKFLKSLADLGKAKSPEDQLVALDEIKKESELLRKAAKGDKEFIAYVDSIDKAIAKEEKLARDTAKESAEDEGEEESPALLTTKMIPLIRQVKKGEQMQVLVANAGTEVALLMSRRPISPSRRKLLAEYLDGATPKYLPGVCILEENAYTFVLKSKAAGLAKKIKAALLKQVELRLKVRVRGEDPDDIDDDGDPDDSSDDLTAEGKDANAGTGIPTPPPPPPDPLKMQFDQRWPDLEKRVLERLKLGAGDVSKLRAVAEFVREKSDSGNYKAAVQALESLEKLLPATEPSVTKTGGDPATAFTERLAALMPAAKTAIAAGGNNAQEIKLKVSEAGVFARKKDFDQANALLDVAEDLIKSASESSGSESNEGEGEDPQASGQQGSPEGGDATDMEAAVKQWRTVRDRTVAKLKALIKEMADDKDPGARDAIIEVSAVFKQLNGEPRTAQQVSEMRKWLQEDDVVDDVCEIDEDIRGPLLEALEGVQQVLKAA